MTAVDKAAERTAPTPRRLSRPRWMDPRILGGLLLVIAAVVVGSRVVAASAQTTPIWAATKTMAVGTVLTQGDLEPVEVNLGDSSSRYLSAASSVLGRTVAIQIGAGELIPADALGDAPIGRIVVIPVPPDKFPPGVDHGSVIDLYLTAEVTAAAGAATGGGTDTSLLKSELTVQSVVAPDAGGLSGASANQYQIAVLVDAKTADELVRMLPQGEAVIVLVAGR